MYHSDILGWWIVFQWGMHFTILECLDSTIVLIVNVWDSRFVYIVSVSIFYIVVTGPSAINNLIINRLRLPLLIASNLFQDLIRKLRLADLSEVASATVALWARPFLIIGRQARTQAKNRLFNHLSLLKAIRLFRYLWLLELRVLPL